MGSKDIVGTTAVHDMQDMLIKLGYSCGPDGADGEFGANTRAALITFQTQKGLTPDGIYGPASKEALEKAYKSMFGTDSESATAINSAADAAESAKQSVPEWSPKLGETVKFTGDIQYLMPRQMIHIPAKAGIAKVTMVMDSAKHPYHIIGVRGNSESATVAGWVDLDALEKCD